MLSSVNPAERAMLEAAADLDVLAHTIVIIPPTDWEGFEAWANRPVEAIALLVKFAALDLALSGRVVGAICALPLD